MENKIHMLSTPSCTKCPIVKSQLAEKDVEVEYVNVEEDPSIPADLGVLSIPTLVDNRKGEATLYTGQSKVMEFISKL